MDEKAARYFNAAAETEIIHAIIPRRLHSSITSSSTSDSDKTKEIVQSSDSASTSGSNTNNISVGEDDPSSTSAPDTVSSAAPTAHELRRARLMQRVSNLKKRVGVKRMPNFLPFN